MKATWNEIRYWLKGQTFWEYLAAFILFYKTIYLCFAYQMARNLILSTTKIIGCHFLLIYTRI